ncbi:MAG: helix-turn-helix domain-containing protein, partial [Candidatus Dormibacteraceae bacterium]
MARLFRIETRQSEGQASQPTPGFASVSHAEDHSNGASHGIEILLTSKEASEVLKIHPKVLERMAKRGEVPALK